MKLKQEQSEKEKEEYEKLNLEKVEIKKEIIDERKKKAEIDSYNIELKFKKEQLEKNKIEYSKLQSKITEHNKNIGIYNAQIDIAKIYISMKAKLLSELIHKHLKDVEIVLEKVVKSTGEVKDTFEIYYQDKEFKVLSTSEKIKAGLEISNLVMNLTNTKYPIFIDNAESITKYNIDINTQVIEARVVEGKELTIIPKYYIEDNNAEKAI